MKRRNFLKIFPTLGASTFVVNGFSMRPYANQKLAQVLSTCEGIEDRILVLIQLKGGNDGINTIVPLNQYDRYTVVRPAIRLAQEKLINLDTTLSAADQVGLHPSMTPFKAMYEKGWATLLQGVGYQNMNQSHFKGTDLWLSGGDTTADNFNIKSGWMGRSLQAMFPDVKGEPTANMLDPLGIQIGDANPSLGFHTETEHQNVINLTGQDAAGFFNLVSTLGGEPIANIPDSEQGDQLEYIMGIERSTSLYAERISQVFNAGSNSVSTYTNTSLANQLKTIARMIKGGCKTKIYLCQLGGFDTHDQQVVGTDTTTGSHANLLNDLFGSVKTFFDDLEGLGIADQVIGCTFSEFGRCAIENGSDGTDHGTLAPMFLFGKNVEAGVLGTNVNLSNLSNDGQVQGVQHDYRQVFTTLLQDWLGADNNVLLEAMFDGYDKIGAINANAVVDPGCYFGTTSAFDPIDKPRALNVFPNPASLSVEVSYNSSMGFDAILSLHSLGGSLVTANNQWIQPGLNLFPVDVSGLPPGIYFVRIENRSNGRAEVCKLNVVR